MTAWRRWILIIASSLLGVATLAGLRASILIGGTFSDEDLAGGDPTPLAGRWSAQLRIGRPAFFLPGVGTPLPAELQLAVRPFRDSLGTQVVCPGCLTGTLVGDFSPLGPGYPAQLAVEAYALHDGRVLLVAGGCCDRGELSFNLRVRGDGLAGSWQQVFLVADALGTASFRRRASP